MLNEYQLLARRSMVCATRLDSLGAMADANRVKQVFNQLNEWTRHYNEDIQQGKWREFFNWQPYHWFRSEKIDPPIATPCLLSQTAHSQQPYFLNEDNVFCRITTDNASFYASATPINNVWHAPYVGPMWSQVGTLHLKKGINHLSITDLKPDARIDRIFLGLWPPLEAEPRLNIAASEYKRSGDSKEGHIEKIIGLGFHDGVLVQPFDTPSYDVESAPYVEYDLDIQKGDCKIEIRTLPTLHVYEGFNWAMENHKCSLSMRETSLLNGDGTCCVAMLPAAFRFPLHFQDHSISESLCWIQVSYCRIF